MEIEVQLTREPIAAKISAPEMPHGAFVEFRGVVRDLENGQKISALGYEAYSPMAENEMRRILESLGKKFPCLAVKIIHRVGIIPVGETAIYVGIVAQHRGEAISLLAGFMDKLKQDVPIWKAQAIQNSEAEIQKLKTEKSAIISPQSALQLNEALLEISSHCAPLPAVRAPLPESFGRALREDIFAPEDLPSADKSTRDGYAILQNDSSENFQIIETIHAADWKPRQIKIGEAVRVATGASLPCESLRVIMQENVERNGGKIKILRAENSANVRRRGEEICAGGEVLKSGVKLDAGKLAALASAGGAQPLVSPKLCVCHFTTGDEIVPPEKTPQPSQIRDSNSILVRALLQKFSRDISQQHLPEDFETAKSQVENCKSCKSRIESADVILISGGASVGEKDFTRPLLEWLGFEIIFSQVNIRPGRPLIFGVKGNQIAFGLPGNPVSHFVCFHLFVAAALAKLAGVEPENFLRGRLAEKLEDAANARETFWPARFEFANGEIRLRPLKWSSSGDVTCLAETSALIRVPANRGSIEKGADVDFLPTTDMLDA